MTRVRASQPGGLAAFAAVLILVAAVLNVHVPYFALTPGPARDVGELIKIDGGNASALNGELLLTTVSLHEIPIYDAVRGWFDPSIAIVSRSAIIPSGSSETDVEERTTAQMEESHTLAAAAALRLLDYSVTVEPSGARVQGVGEGVPASRTLRTGDVIIGADGQPVKRAEDLVAVIGRHKVGDTIGLRIMRGTETIDVATQTIGRPENPLDPFIGIFLETVPRVKLPLAVKIDSLGIGGPSAGLMFALGIYDLLDPGDLTRGRIIAGTGEILIDGQITAVGGIRQKVESARRAGAQLFIVPQAELGQACAMAKGMPIVGVDSLKQAVDALAGATPAAGRSCP